MAKLPPGPVGGRLWHTLKVLRAPYGHFDVLKGRYGDPFTVSTVFGTMVVTGRPEGIKEIFTGDAANYVALNKEMSAPLIGQRSVLLLDGEAHRAERKLLQPPFHGQRMRAYGELICEIAARHAAAWPRHGRFDVYEPARKMSLEVIMRAVIGVTDPARNRALTDELLSIFQNARVSFLYFRFLRSRLWPPWVRFQRTRQRAAALLTEELEARRRDPAPREDILSMLMEARYEDGSAMSDAALLDELATLLQAGYETTAASIAWAFYGILRHPHVLERLRDELMALGPSPDAAALAQHPYLDAVVNESLRLYPLIGAVGRQLAQPMTLLGFEVPAGLTVGASTYLAHRNPETYPDPEAFRPERFLERKPTVFEFLPFGGGPRRCLGAALAHYEIKLVVGTILATLELKLASDKPLREKLNVAFIAPAGPVELERAA